MISADKLEEAILIRDSLSDIKAFLSGYGGEEGWKGRIELTFGSYHCKVAESVKNLVCDALIKQRTEYESQLRELGVNP